MWRLVTAGILGSATVVGGLPQGAQGAQGGFSGAARGAARSDPVNPLVVQTSSGAVRGVARQGYRVFRGIPYAAPPVGDLRLRPPQRHPGWSEVLEASDFGPSCYQNQHPCWNTLNQTTMSEDCLTINVFTPAKNGTYPVMFYIHAGEFRCGSSNDRESDFPYFAEDVVLVTFNFRLGALGFLALEELRPRHPQGGTGNYGLLDQRLALDWTRENIAAFGGDPSRVTIWGESSGGASVGYHLTAAGKAPSSLFQRAILQSPGLTQVKSWQAAALNGDFVLAVLAAAKSPGCNHTAGYLVLADNQLASRKPLHKAEDLTLEAAQVWCSGNASCMGFWRAQNTTTFVDSLRPIDREADGHSGCTAFVRRGPADPADRLRCLLQADAAQMVQRSLQVPRDDTFETDGWAPVIDGVDLVEPILDRVQRGEVAAGVDILAGANLDDGTEFMSLTPFLACNATKADFQQWLVTFYGQQLSQDVEAAYRPTDLLRPLPACQAQSKVPAEQALYFNAAMRSAGDKAVTCPTRRLALQGTGRSFAYNFKRTPTYSENFDDTSVMGAFHGAEVPFAFGASFELVSADDKALAAQMGCFWRSFAHHGDPGRDCAVPWPAITAAGRPVMSLDVVVQSAPEDELSAQRCDLFERASKPGASAVAASAAAVAQPAASFFTV